MKDDIRDSKQYTPVSTITILLLAVGISCTFVTGGCTKKTGESVNTPSAPHSLTAKFQKNHVLIQWEAPVEEIVDYYGIYRRLSNAEEYSFLLSVTETTYSDFHIQPGSTYWYVVTAFKNGRESPFSNEVSITIPNRCLPGEEVCDGLDNDCDGDIDELPVCTGICDSRDALFIYKFSPPEGEFTVASRINFSADVFYNVASTTSTTLGLYLDDASGLSFPPASTHVLALTTASGCNSVHFQSSLTIPPAKALILSVRMTTPEGNFIKRFFYSPSGEFLKPITVVPEPRTKFTGAMTFSAHVTAYYRSSITSQPVIWLEALDDEGNYYDEFVQGYTEGYTEFSFTMPVDCFTDEINVSVYMMDVFGTGAILAGWDGIYFFKTLDRFIVNTGWFLFGVENATLSNPEADTLSLNRECDTSGDFTIQPSASWIETTPASGNTPSSISVSVKPSYFMSFGLFESKIEISGSNVSAENLTVVVLSYASTIFTEDFENSITGWTYSGLWHLVTDGATAAPASSISPSHAFWYGQESTGNYDTGLTSTGGLTSPVFSIPAGLERVYLMFYSWEETENFPGYDVRQVYIGPPANPFETLIFDSEASPSSWRRLLITIPPSYIGTSVVLTFYFDTGDEFDNAYRGWMIDDIMVVGY